MMYNNPQDIRDEIAELKQKLETTTPTDNEEFYGRIHHSLGRLLTQLAVFEKPVGHLEEALKHYNIAETFITVIEEPIHYPNMLNDKGLVYLELARQRNMQENLRRAEAIFKDVLTFWKPETHPREYAGVHINLIGLCLDLSVADTTHQEEHVLRALHYAQEGLKYESRMFAREKFLTYDNLGQTYTELGKLYQDVTYYDKAIVAFQKTLTYLSPDAQPHDYAITSGNLSQALTYKAYLANDHKSWQEVLDILQPACEKYKQVGRMDLYGAGSLNIALAYWNLAELTEKDSEKLAWLRSVETNARLATQYLVDNEWQWRDRLDAYVLAGDACKELAYLEKPNEYFPKAVVYYKQSLDKRLISIAALTYANVNHNIGRILVHLRKEPESIPYLREAEKYYRINNELEQANLIRQNLVLIESPARQFVQGFKNWLNRKQ